MKHIIVYEILDKLKRNPKLMRKAKVFAVVGLVGFLLIGTLTIWAGLSAINYLASSVNQAIQSPITQGHVESEIKSLPSFQAVNCWGKAQTLLGVRPWLDRPAFENLTNLKVACFEQKSNLCEGSNCEHMNEISNSVKGSFI